MIVFTKIKDIPIEMLEVKGVRRVIKYNLSSYFADVQTLNKLIPSISGLPEEMLEGDISVIPHFDIAYGNYIINDNEAFMQFMSLIVPVYESPDTLVQVLIQNSDYRDSITETLAKLIQQRYGYNTHIINELEDFLYTEEPTFSIPGLFTLDKDLARWRFMMNPNGEYYDE